MADNGMQANTTLDQKLDWEKNFKNRHLTDIESTEFLSSYRTVIYARPATVNGSDVQNGNIVESNANEFVAIGVVQAYNWNEQREVQRIFELGSDIPYVVPGRTIGAIQLQRIMINGDDIVNALYNGKMVNGTERAAYTIENSLTPLNSLKDITKPMDILFVAFATNGKDGSKKYSRVFKNCHIESRQESIGAGQVIIAESCSIIYETIVGVTLPGSKDKS